MKVLYVEFKGANIFFNDYVDHYHKLNSRKIGLKMKLVREANDMSKTELDMRLNFNWKMIALLEDGERLPSITYIIFVKYLIIRLKRC